MQTSDGNMNSQSVFDSRTAGPGTRAVRQRAFTLTEIIVAVSIAALIFSAASLLFQSIGANSKRLSTIVTFPIGTVAANNFFGLAVSEISVYSAPNYGRAAFAEEMREIFWDDVGAATAVHCLARNSLNTVRPATIPFPASPNPEILDTAEAFRQHLVAEFPSASTIFLPYRNVPISSNGSVFVTGPSASATGIDMIAIYEIDFLTSGNPAGTYAAVRRYVDGALTNYYDAFYPQGTGTLFQPLYVAFERRTRLAFSEGPGSHTTPEDWPDRFKVARERPFYMMWWPDPAEILLESQNTWTGASSDPRSEYGHMAGRTSYMFTVPMFPAL